MLSEHTEGSGIEKKLLDAIPKGIYIDTKILKSYCNGRSVIEIAREMKDPENYVRYLYSVLHKLCLEHGIEIPKNEKPS